MTKTPFQDTIVRRTATTEQLHALEDVLHPDDSIDDVSVTERDEKTIITVAVGYNSSTTLDEWHDVLDLLEGVVDTLSEDPPVDPDEAYVRTLPDNATITLHYNYGESDN